MEINEILATAALLASSASALVEYFKTLAVAWLDRLTEDVRAAVVQGFALLACVAIAFIADFDVIHRIFPAAPMSHLVAVAFTGIGLLLPADGLRLILEFIKAGRDRMEITSSSETKVTTSSTTPEGQVPAATARVVVTPASSPEPTHNPFENS